MNKNILIIDNSHKTIELLNLIVKMFTNYTTLVETNRNSISILISNTSFDYIIIDHLVDYADEIIIDILNFNPKQKIILLSDHIKCPIACEDCFSLYNFVRLIKPIKAKEILNYFLNDFTCPNKDKFNSINTLSKLYDFINLEENINYQEKELFDNKIIIKSSMANINIIEISKIEKSINDSFFNMKLNENSDIEIFVK